MNTTFCYTKEQKQHEEILVMRNIFRLSFLLGIDVCKNSLPWINVHNFYMFRGRELTFLWPCPVLVYTFRIFFRI